MDGAAKTTTRKHPKTYTREFVDELRRKLRDLPPRPRNKSTEPVRIKYPPLEFRWPTDEELARASVIISEKEQQRRRLTIIELYWKRRLEWREAQDLQAVRRCKLDENFYKELDAEEHSIFGEPELTISAALDSDARAVRLSEEWDETQLQFAPVYVTRSEPK